MQLMTRVFIIGLLCIITGHLNAQDSAPKWTPEELKELFGYCDKPELISKYKFATDITDKIAEIDYWARQQQKTITANTNEVYATNGELEKEVIKKYKALKVSDEQFKALMELRQLRENKTASCPVTILSENHKFDTLTAIKALQLYKTQFRKPLLDKLGINGRQADMLFEIEIWKQKEAITVAAISVTDFSRIRKTVAMYAERERRFRVVGLTDEQRENAILYFDQHQL